MITYTTNHFGLREKDMHYLLSLFVSVPSIEKVVLYGSRALGHFEKASDIDLALVGSMITNKDVSRIHNLIECQGPMLLWADVLHYESLKNKELRRKIDETGKIIYVKMATP